MKTDKTIERMRLKMMAVGVCAALVGVCTSCSVEERNSFAIVVDSLSMTEAKTEIEAYAHAIEEVNGLQVVTVVDRWGVPDSIKAVLQGLYADAKAPLCGAVFVGDIPIAMVRDAQHMTSAFKMSQAMDRKQSSVPSDRFYDDFDLRFDYQGKDEEAPYYYYSLRGDCPQQLAPEIFTGRIRPTDVGGTTRYEKLRAYLKKATRAKYADNRLDKVFYFTGSGSLNESKVAAIDEKMAYYEHFPWLTEQGQSISYMDHSQSDCIRENMMNELMREDLDVAVLHHHGDPNIQYLNRTAVPTDVLSAKRYMQQLLRHELRRAKQFNRDVEGLIRHYSQEEGIPQAWYTDVTSPEVVYEDSLSEARANLYISDFADYGFRPNARFVLFDACYNASFHMDDCIANAYIFSDGETVAAVGGTVNLLQDKWYDKLLGLLGTGMYAGYFNLFQNYLEEHLVGDPTFTFAPAREVTDINGYIAKGLRGETVNRPAEGNDLPDVQALTLMLQYRNGQVSAEQLLQELQQSPYSQVRMMALQLLADYRGDALVEGIKMASNDRNEMVQRFAINDMRYNGDPRLAPALMRVYLDNNASERVAFNAHEHLVYFQEEVLMPEFEKQFAEKQIVYKDSMYRVRKEDIKEQTNRWEKYVDRLFKPELSDGEFDFVAHCMRLYCPHHRVPDVLRYIRESDNAQRQQALLEAMGWMRMSYNAPLIAQQAKAMSEDTSLPDAVRQEALKTYHRVK